MWSRSGSLTSLRFSATSKVLATLQVCSGLPTKMIAVPRSLSVAAVAAASLTREVET